MINRKMAALVAVVLLAVVVGSAATAMASCYYVTLDSVDGYLSGSGDEDLYSVELTKGVRYNFRLSVGYGDDFDIWVYYKVWDGNSWEKQYVAMGIEGTGVDESVYFTASRNTRHYVEVISWVGRGDYTFSFRRQICN
ncbi:hypothetical protein IH601_12300 [Candidatus Bipolaricaulota bacterium]|jgi:hypothetical protein|nr:hypothetical protein [Candidatus Bipolaricaulota bacterium]TFH10687.1 MAG: hypothetical protein E4H08_03130 [Candidatus Atribacteria bacterium]